MDNEKKSLKERFIEKKNQAKEKLSRAIEWAKENPEDASTIGLAVLGVAGFTIKTGKRISKAKKEEKRRRTVYCGDIDSKVELKHELDYYEKDELRERMDSGQTRYQALRAMDLVKK